MWLGALCLAGCASTPVPAPNVNANDVDDADGPPPLVVPLPEPLKLADADWLPVALPGKAETRYSKEAKDGRTAVRARSHRSASLLRRQVTKAAHQVGEVSFSWWVPQLLAKANVAEVASEDAAVRVVFAFGGDVSRLPLRTRMQFELMQALTGEPPPFATLMYVWDNQAAVGSVVVNPRSDRIRKIVLDTGPSGLRQWRDHRRNLREDFRRAFGEDPGPLQAVAVMTDTDNTGGQAEAWYGPVTFH